MWYKSKIVIPPARKDIYIWKDGKCQKVNMDSYDIYDGKGDLHPELFEYWSNVEEKEPPHGHMAQGSIETGKV